MMTHSIAKRILISALLTSSLGFVRAWAWDGNWTQAESGRGDVIYDPDSTQGMGSVKDRPQKYFIPPPRDWADVDAEEGHDYKHKDYAPYALARINQGISYEGK